jgi:hypothetical protein
MQMQQPIKHLFKVLGFMDFACTALVISTTQILSLILAWGPTHYSNNIKS